MTRARMDALEREEQCKRKRHDGSQGAIRRTLARGAAISRSKARVLLETDKKSSYPGLAREAFGTSRLIHRMTSSKLPRTVSNPLFPINHTEAVLRDLVGRLRRDSWLVSKKRRYLDLALQLLCAWRNLVRKRFNHDRESSACMLGFAPRRMSEEELCSWRQDWGKQSVHPLSQGRSSVAEMLRAG